MSLDAIRWRHAADDHRAPPSCAPPREGDAPRASVDVWSLALPVPTRHLGMLEETLSSDEHKRAQRFLGADKRLDFIACRGAMRMLLGRYLGTPPAQIRFSTLEQGKPKLTQRSDLHFNLSHTDGLMLAAVSSSLEVGIDVEKVRPVPAAAQLARRYFTAGERAAMADEPATFLRLWTCRESVLKAIGCGIAAGWDSVRILLRASDTADAIGLGCHCRVRLFTPSPGYVAAIAAIATDFHLRQYEFDPTHTDPPLDWTRP